MKIRTQKSGQGSAKPASKKAGAQVRDVALSVVEQGLKKPTKPRPERSERPAPAATEGHRPAPRPRDTEAREKRPARPVRSPEPEHTPTSVRLFFALKVPTAVSNRLAETQRKLKGNWRNVRPDQMHVTLTYMPAVPIGQMDAVKKLGTELLRDFAPMDIKLRGTGYFPNEGSPRVWFVKVEAAGLDELAEKLRLGVAGLGIATDDLAFKAHITLARKKGPAPRVPPQLFELGWTATGAALYRSHLQKTGPIYEIQSTFRFLGEESVQMPENAAESALPLPHSGPATNAQDTAQEQP